MIRVSANVNASAADLFSLSQDYSRRLKWDTFLREARVEGNRSPGVGVRTYCRAWTGIGMETEYVSFQLPTVVAVKMTRGPFLFREFAATWRFEELENDAGTRVTFIYHFKTRPGLLTPIVGALLEWEIRRRLRDFKTYAESFASH